MFYPPEIRWVLAYPGSGLSPDAPRSETITEIPVRRLFDLPCHAATRETAAQFARRAVAERRPRRVLFMNASKVIQARGDARVRQTLERADLVGADGQSIVWAGKLLGEDIPWRMAGIDFMLDLLRTADAEGWRVFFLGSTEETLDGVVAHCARNFPGLVVAGRHHGYFGAEDDAEVADEIRAAGADLLFVGMPSPRKEFWLDEQYERANVPLAVGVGGSYDVMIGSVSRAPRLWQVVGLEWAWRFVHEPRRLFRRYASTNTRFLALLAREYARQKRPKQA